MIVNKGNKMKSKLIVAALVSSLVSPAFAWGDREQGILTGVAGLWLWQRLNQPQVIGSPQGYPVPQGPMVGQLPTQTMPHILLNPNCRQVLTIQYDRFGNEYRYPATVCN